MASINVDHCKKWQHSCKDTYITYKVIYKLTYSLWHATAPLYHYILYPGHQEGHYREGRLGGGDKVRRGSGGAGQEDPG